MPFEIVRNDIVNMQVDAVVNTANPNPVIGSGVDSGIHKKTGEKLLFARQKIGCIAFGDAAITPGFNLDAGFSETLLQLIDRTGKKDSVIYKKANVDRKLFSKIRNNMDYKPSKTTALAFAFALELDVDETKDFIGRAGFALSHSSKFDVIVEYFLVNRNYDVFELNEVLFAFDQPLIGA